MQETQDTMTVEKQDVGSESKTSTNTRRNIIIAIVAIVVLALFAAAIYGMVTHPVATSVVRDISIIALALVTLVIGLFLVILIFQLQSLIALLRDEIKPILDSANETASTVRGTTTFVSDAVVTPLIQVASVASGVKQTIQTLTGTGRKRKRQRTGQPGPTEK
jgi:hypothetical protein